MDIPNIVTLSRYAGALIFVAACAAGAGAPWSTLVLILLIAVYTTDIVDGELARRRPDRPPTVGQVLDSATDSYTFILVFIALFVAGAIPLITLVVVVAGRALFDLIRFVGFALDHVYAAPIPLSKAKGFVYTCMSCLLYAVHAVPAFAGLDRPAVTASANLLVVASTVLAAAAFLQRHRTYVRSIVSGPARAVVKG